MRFDGNITSNQSIVELEGITGGSNLFCLTNTTTCCRGVDTRSGAMGLWYFPDGTPVPDSGSGLVQERGASFVTLTYTSSTILPPSGLYRCVIPDSDGINITLFAGIYESGQGTAEPLYYSHHWRIDFSLYRGVALTQKYSGNRCLHSI